MIDTRRVAAHTPLLDLLRLTSLRTQADKLESPDEFLALAVETARRTFGVREAFLVLANEDAVPTIVATPGATCAVAVRQSSLALRSERTDAETLAAWAEALRSYGNPDLCCMECHGEAIGILGLLGAAPPLDSDVVKQAGQTLGIVIDNYRAYHDARFHLARQSLLQDIGRIFSAPGALDEKLHAFVRRMGLLPHVDGCTIALLGDRAGSHRAECHLNGLTISMHPDLERSVLNLEAPFYVEDTTDRYPSTSPILSYLGFPLMRGETAIGTLSIVARRPAAFQRKNMEFIAAVSEHIALNLDNAWLLEETQKQVQELTFVAHMSSVLRREKTLSGVLQCVLEKCVASVQANVGYLFLVEGEELKLSGCCGAGAARHPVAVSFAEELRYSENPLVDFSATFRQPALVSLTETMSTWQLVPLCTDRGLLGVLLLGSARGQTVTKGERRLISTVVNAAENAIGRATAFEEMQARVREEAASRAKSEFLAIMSHELRSPLSTILGFTELLAEDQFGPTNATQQQYLQEVLISARHLLSLINDILDLARVDAGRVELACEAVPVQEVLEGVVRSFCPLVRRKGINLRVRPGVPTLETVWADPKRLKQILDNLVSNAVKFTDAGGWVELGVTSDDGIVHFEVQDSGIGIPPDEHEKIFKPFVQGTRPRGRVYEGTGLGLSLSRRLADLHKGELYVSSQPGVGSIFHLLLPQGGPS